MKEIALQNSGRTMTMCACSNDCRARFVLGEMCLTEGEGYKILPSSKESKLLHLTGNDIVGIFHSLEEIVFSVEDEKSIVPLALLVAIYFDPKLENNKYAAQLIFASNKNGSEDFSNDQEFDFWIVPVREVKGAKRLDAVPSILGNHTAFVEFGTTKIYL